jgi:hypothetical protein
MRAITVEEICKKLKPVLGKKIDQLYLKYALSDNRDDKEQIQRLLNLLYEKHLNTTLLDEKILLEPPKKDLIEGKYPLGVVTYADRNVSTFGLREQDWPRHICITGMSGSGKTTFAFQILANFIMHKKPFIVFDWKKSFRPLMQIDKEIMCFTVGNDNVSNLFKININEPPKGVGPKEWVSILCDLIVESFFASFGVHKVIREVMDQAFRDFGVYKGSKNYPTWKQIKDRLEEKADEMHGRRGRESEWMESALRIADSLTFGSFGDAINCKDSYGFTVSELLQKKVIFELHALGTAEKKFFCEFLLNYIYFMKKFNQEGYSSTFKNAIIVDEAHHIFLKNKPNFMKESIPEVIYRELREYGISLICLDQHISKLSEVVAGNSATNIAFQQVLPQDVETISSLMQLRERRKYFSMLPVGEAIVRLAERHYEPFHFKVPNIDVKSKVVKDKVIRENMQELVKFHKRKKIFKDRCKEKNIKKMLQNIDTIYKVSGVKTKGDLSDIRPSKKEIKQKLQHLYSLTNTNINKTHKDFMQVLRKKALPTTQAYSRLKLSSRKCDRIKSDLIGQGLIEVEEIRNQRGRSKLLRLSEKGLQLLETAG